MMEIELILAIVTVLNLWHLTVNSRTKERLIYWSREDDRPETHLRIFFGSRPIQNAIDVNVVAF